MTSVHMLPADDPASAESLMGRSQPSYPGARWRAIQRLRQVQREMGEERRERYDADRLLRDLRSVREAVEDPRVLASRLADGADDREELRRRYGWTDERIDQARNDLQGRVHPPRRSSLVAGGGPGGATGPSQSRPSPAVAPSRERTWGEAQIARFGVVYPRIAGSLRSGSPDRPFQPDQAPASRRSPRLAGSTTPPANRRASRAQGRRRS